jgi:hypothetical protein
VVCKMKTYNQFLNTPFSEEVKPEPPEEDNQIASKQKRQMQIKKQVLLKKMQAVRAGAGADIVASYEPEGELVEGKKKGLWDNIHAKRKRGEKPAKPGDKDYPKTLNVEGKGYQPEIEHSKLGDAKKKADKKRESKLPPHLQGDAIGKMKKAFASEGAAWTKKAGKNPEGGLNEKGRKSYERENPGSDLKAPQPEGGSRKKSFCARMKGMRKRQKPSNNTGKDRLSLSLKKWKCNEEKISAFDFVKKKIEKEVGKSGYVSKDNPRKPQSAADKAKARAHQAKVDKENAAERAKDPSQGRYPKG